MKTRGTCPIIGVVAILLALPVMGTAQQRQQQGQQMQQRDRIHQLDQMAQRMDRMQDRVRQMDQVLLQELDRLRMQQQDQDRIRQHERLRDMADSFGKMGLQMRTTLMQARQMEGDPLVQRNEAMQQEMERLRLHLQTMCDGMEEGLQIMERIHERVRAGGGPTG